MAKTKEQSAVQPAEKARIRIFNELAPMAQDVAKQIEDHLSKTSRGNVATYYNIGALVDSLMNNEDKVGDQAVPQIAAYLNNDGGVNALYRYRQVFRTYDKETVTSMTEKPLPDGSFLSISHWIALSQIADDDKRAVALQTTVDKSFSANDLELWISSSDAGKTKHSRSGGRKPAVPNNVAMAVQKTYALACQFVRYTDAATASIVAGLEELPPVRVSAEFVAKIQEVADELQKDMDNAAALKKALLRQLPAMQRKLEAAKEKAAKGEKPDKKKKGTGKGKEKAQARAAKAAKTAKTGKVAAKGKAKGKAKKKPSRPEAATV